MRARLALYISGAKVELREITFKNKPVEMLEISPKATVPVLQLIDGTVIDESLDIMTYALGRQDPDEWLGTDPKTTTTLITQNDTTFKYALDRYKYPNRFPEEDCSQAFDTCTTILKGLNTHIKTNNGALLGHHNTLADYAIFPFIRQCANVDRARFQSLNLKPLEIWLTTHLESKLFATIMHKYAPWKNGNTPITL